MTKICQFCNKEFKTRKRKQRFCSYTCCLPERTGARNPRSMESCEKICLQCKKRFSVKIYDNDQKYCSNECGWASKINKKRSKDSVEKQKLTIQKNIDKISGKNHHNFKNALKIFNCIICNAEVKRYEKQVKKNKNGFVCSKKCLGKLISKRQTKDKNANWSGDKITLQCDNCQNNIEKTQRQFKKQKYHFCNLNCWYEFSSRNIRGQNCPAWRGGKSPLLILVRKLPEYKTWRKLVYDRDDYRCRICNISRELNAHHIKSFAQIIKENNINSIEDALKCEELWNISNGITLCENCHQKTPNYGFKAWRNKLCLEKI